MDNISFLGLLIVAAVAVTAVAAIGFIVVTVRSRAKETDFADGETSVATVDAPTRETLDVEAPESPTPQPQAQPVEAPPSEDEAVVVIPPADEIVLPEALPETVTQPPVVEERVGLAEKVRLGLARTRTALGDRLGSILSRDKLDEEAWEELEEALIRADVGVSAATKIVQELRELKPAPEQVEEMLADRLTALLRTTDQREFKLEPKPAVWLITGVNGVGKTTSIAKLAHRLRGEGREVVLAAGDTFRAAAIEQLGTWADRLGVHMVKHAPESDPSAVVFDAISYAKARGVDVVIADTAGRLHTKSNLMEELKKIRRVAEREAGEIAEVLLVLDATVGQNGISQAKTFQEAIDVTGVILTKLDGTAKGGIVVAIQDQLQIPVKAIGVGEGMDDLQTFDPELFVKAMLGKEES